MSQMPSAERSPPIARWRSGGRPYNLVPLLFLTRRARVLRGSRFHSEATQTLIASSRARYFKPLCGTVPRSSLVPGCRTSYARRTAPALLFDVGFAVDVLGLLPAALVTGGGGVDSAAAAPSSGSSLHTFANTLTGLG